MSIACSQQFCFTFVNEVFGSSISVHYNESKDTEVLYALPFPIRAVYSLFSTSDFNECYEDNIFVNLHKIWKTNFYQLILSFLCFLISYFLLCVSNVSFLG